MPKVMMEMPKKGGVIMIEFDPFGGSFEVRGCNECIFVKNSNFCKQCPFQEVKE